MMKLGTKIRLAIIVSGMISALCLGALVPVLAQDTSGPTIGNKSPSGPSAKRAAQLKYHPPDNYLKHYLGDDRYKIAGGVWKVVSTQLDTYYHRANCPNMLKQSPDIVIGFSGKADAEEGGYRADPVCQPKEVAVIYGQAQGSVTDYLASERVVKLADNASTVKLPASWRRVNSGSSEFLGMHINTDIFQRKGSKGSVVIQTTNWPGQNAEQLLNMYDSRRPSASMNREMEQFQSGMQSANPSSGNTTGKKFVSTPGKWGGLKAYYIKNPVTSFNAGGRKITIPAINSVLAAKGSNLYQIIDTDRSNDAQKIRDSFKPK